MNSSDQRSPVLWIMAAVAVWAIGLGIAVTFVWHDRLQFWRAVIVIGTMGLFIGGWTLLLWRTGRLK